MHKDNWARHTVAVPTVTRTIDSWLFHKRTMEKPARIEREEMVHVHDCYRQKVDGKVLSTLWHRGARVGAV